ncbi:MAG: hypothetical protein AAGA66_07475 [Bacteroidota bacterium]
MDDELLEHQDILDFDDEILNDDESSEEEFTSGNEMYYRTISDY